MERVPSKLVRMDQTSGGVMVANKWTPCNASPRMTLTSQSHSVPCHPRHEKPRTEPKKLRTGAESNRNREFRFLNVKTEVLDSVSVPRPVNRGTSLILHSANELVRWPKPQTKPRPLPGRRRGPSLAATPPSPAATSEAHGRAACRSGGLRQTR